MTATTEVRTTTQVFRVFIKATPQAIWDAIASPEWSAKYGYPGHNEYDLRPGGAYRAVATPEMVSMGVPEVMVDGEVVEAEPPHKLVQTWRFLFTPELTAEGFTKVTWEIAAEEGGLSRLTVTHELEGAPQTAAQVFTDTPLGEGGGGWSWVLSDLKTLLETGTSLESDQC